MPEQLTAADFPVSAERRARVLRDLLEVMDTELTAPSQPQLVFVTGQPAAGKSATITRIQAGLSQRAAVMDSDEIRQNHPQMPEIVAADPQRMDILSNGPVGEWMGGSIEHARQRSYNTIIENTLTNPAQVTETAGEFRQAGYGVSVAALAVPEHVSRLGVVTRYLAGTDSDEFPRWTSERSHSAAYSGMVTGLQEMTGVVDTIEVYTRQGDQLYAGPDGDAAARAVVEHRAAPLSAEDVARWAGDYGVAAGRVMSDGLVNESTSALLGQLARDAERVIPPADLPVEHHRLLDALDGLKPDRQSADLTSPPANPSPTVGSVFTPLEPDTGEVADEGSSRLPSSSPVSGDHGPSAGMDDGRGADFEL
jgi:UDP-N-acetylglucosamine kinase